MSTRSQFEQVLWKVEILLETKTAWRLLVNVLALWKLVDEWDPMLERESAKLGLSLAGKLVSKQK